MAGLAPRGAGGLKFLLLVLQSLLSRVSPREGRVD